MSQSSGTYSTELIPDPRLRLLVLVTGAAVVIAGILAAAATPPGGRLRVAIAIGWGSFGLWQLLRMAASFRDCARIRLDAESGLAIVARDGSVRPAALIAGSLVLPRLAWLRYRCESGAVGADLFTGDARKSEAWRRLQVIWRHLPASLGGGV